MEIPKADKYESKEKIEKINFLDENLKVSFSFNKEAIPHLPEVSDDDLVTKKEKYRILLGDFEKIGSDNININVNGILEADPEGDEVDLFYQERKNEIVLDLGAVKKWVKAIQNSNSDLEDYNLVGDIHSHPVLKNDLEGNLNPCDLSQGDFDDVVKAYESGILSSDKPFVFGVAGRETTGSGTSYVFYRLVKNENGYFVKLLGKK